MQGYWSIVIPQWSHDHAVQCDRQVWSVCMWHSQQRSAQYSDDNEHCMDYRCCWQHRRNNRQNNLRHICCLGADADIWYRMTAQDHCTYDTQHDTSDSPDNIISTYNVFISSTANTLYVIWLVTQTSQIFLTIYTFLQLPRFSWNSVKEKPLLSSNSRLTLSGTIISYQAISLDEIYNLPVFRRQDHAVVEELRRGRSHRHIRCLLASSASSPSHRRSRQNEQVHRSCMLQGRQCPVDRCSQLTQCSWDDMADICHLHLRTWTTDIQQHSMDHLGHVGMHHTGQLPVTQQNSLL